MLTFRVTDQLDAMKQAIGDIGARHIKRSTAIALTWTAKQAEADLRAAMSRDLDRPTNWTLNSLYTRSATQDNPVATVWLKDFAPKGIPASKYLAPEIDGGPRRQKRFERALQTAGILPAGMLAVPGAACPIDAYGNVPGPFIVKMLSQLRAFGEQGYRANETDKGKARRLNRDRRTGDWLVVRTKRGKLIPGIYRRYHFGQGNTVKPIFIFVSRATYAKRFRFWETVEGTARREFPIQFAKAFNQALTRFGA